ncbi:ankyrin repeat domain-containing protein 39 [Halyomorpha halys]|uniref:ankyrin repeat domain-containing protein 39 n=1 Tax=Halyomorpha halys TaxID=286706 RepID=UPI0006D523B0|nr:ankyrin repeat domain-containing protein 39 [Halyomorpha halys]
MPLLFILSTDLLFKDIRNFKGPTYLEMDHHSVQVIPSVHQTLDEMDFERGIWTSALMGDITKVRDHLRKGVNVDVEDNNGYTALHYASRNGHHRICNILLDAGASVDKCTHAGGATALHRAAMSGHSDTCELLLHYGANLLARDVDGRTPLHRAVEQGQKDVIALFLKAMPASAFEKDNKGRNPLDYAEDKETISPLFSNIDCKTLQ